MSVEANKDVVRRYMQAVMDADIATIESLQHKDVKWWVLGVGALDRDSFKCVCAEWPLVSGKARGDDYGDDGGGRSRGLRGRGRNDLS